MATINVEKEVSGLWNGNITLDSDFELSNIKEEIKNKIIDGNDFGYVEVDGKRVGWELNCDVSSIDGSKVDFHDLMEDSKKEIIDCILEDGVKQGEIDDIIEEYIDIDAVIIDITENGEYLGKVFFNDGEEIISFEYDDKKDDLTLSPLYYGIFENVIRNNESLEAVEVANNATFNGPSEIVNNRNCYDTICYLVQSQVEWLKELEKKLDKKENREQIIEQIFREGRDCGYVIDEDGYCTCWGINRDDNSGIEIIFSDLDEGLYRGKIVIDDEKIESWMPSKKNKHQDRQHEKEDMDR